MNNNFRIALLFVIINFCVAYISDNVLNDLSKYSNIKAFNSLLPYFKTKSVVGAGIYAGLTVAFATILLIMLYNMIFNTYLPDTSSFKYSFSTFMVYIIFFIIAYIIGYALDVFIYKMKIFDNLESFYNEVGAGNSGAISFLFSLTISFIVLKFVKYLVLY